MANIRACDHGRDAGAWLELLGSYSGFERQAAVEGLRKLRHAQALPALLLRVNDWVPQVRQAAQEAVRSFLQEAFVPQWIAALDAVVALERAKRADHGALLIEVAEFLAKPGYLPALTEAASHASVAVKRYVFELRWQCTSDQTQRFQMLRQSLVGTDVMTCRQAFARIDGIESAEQRQALIEAACCSRFAPVRSAGLRRALANPVAATASLARAMCFDSSATVRALALAALKANGDITELVAESISRLERQDLPGREKAVALHLLCCADPETASAFCEAALQSESPLVRRVAMSALLSKVSGDQAEALLLLALADPSAKVQRVAVDCVHRGAIVPSEERVMEIALRHGTNQALSRALSILMHSSTWTRLHWLLIAYGQAFKSEHKEICVRALAQWASDARHSFVTPTAEQRALVSTDWGAVALAVPEPLRGLIGFHLKSYQINSG